MEFLEEDRVVQAPSNEDRAVQTNLENAYLDEANLKEAYLKGAYLGSGAKNANIEKAYLCEVFTRKTNSEKDYVDKACLERAYLDYQTCVEQHKVVQKLHNTKLRYEFGNIVERYLMTNDLKKAREEMVEKRIPMSFDNILNVKPQYEAEKYYFIKDDKIFYCSFEMQIDTNRLKMLYTHGTTTNIILAALRYAAISVNNSQQWALPVAVYDVALKHGVTLEGFASPFNSRLLLHNLPYCSLFDTDKSLGSVGNFFEYDFTAQTAAHTMMINPPYILSILNRTATRVIDILEIKQDILLFVTCPAWTDNGAEFYHSLNNNRYLIKRIDAHKNEHYYEDTAGKRVIARFNSVMFILSNYPQTDTFNDISQAWSL